MKNGLIFAIVTFQLLAISPFVTAEPTLYHTKVNIFFGKQILASPTMLLEPDKQSKASMSLVGYQEYRLVLTLTNPRNEPKLDMEFTSGEHKIKRAFNVTLGQKQQIKHSQYEIEITINELE
ncbi:MAG: hypothetical protein OQJ89_02040 [Kangiellaceae bacterium]|nr:hypothetical protein [Kangiellaceae bacterium]MCW8997918.1 hypothetical protein [Kangiellaceae bacterium]MCW9015725.1 hypothetical protein [Kangiellaceae bacterium]